MFVELVVPVAECTTLYQLIDGDTYNIPDSAFDFSSSLSGFVIETVRLYGIGGWMSDVNTGVVEWFQADLGAVFFVVAISTQGFHGGTWGQVTQYKISVSVDGSEFVMVTNAVGEEVEFEGNTTDEYDDVVRNELPLTVQARIVRLIVTAFNGLGGLRWEIEGCPLN